MHFYTQSVFGHAKGDFFKCNSVNRKKEMKKEVVQF